MHGIQEYKEEGEAYTNTSALVSSRFSLQFFLNEIACNLHCVHTLYNATKNLRKPHYFNHVCANCIVKALESFFIELFLYVYI